MYLVLTRVPGVSYRRRLRSLMLCLCDVFRALINSLVCWYCPKSLVRKHAVRKKTKNKQKNKTKTRISEEDRGCREMCRAKEEEKKYIYIEAQNHSEFNPFTAPACKISQAEWCTDQPANNIFSGPIIFIFNAMRFDENPFTYQYKKKKKRRKKRLKGFTFRSFTGRFQVTSWQWRGSNTVSKSQCVG